MSITHVRHQPTNCSTGPGVLAQHGIEFITSANNVITLSPTDEDYTCHPCWLQLPYSAVTDLVDELNRLLLKRVETYSIEYVAQLKAYANEHCTSQDGEDDYVELILDEQVSHNQEMWLCSLDADGVILTYADEDYEGTESIGWSELEYLSELLTQIVTDPTFKNIIQL